jgi:hypothetical protein
MNKEIEKQFINEFPTFFIDMYGDPKVTCMHWGICVGEGWKDLLWKMCEKIKNELGEQSNFKFEQIKEKFGILRVYSSGTTDKIHEIIREAELESSKICENCGTREKVSTETKHFWIKTLCENCSK